jgi:hypothetical protein
MTASCVLGRKRLYAGCQTVVAERCAASSVLNCVRAEVFWWLCTNSLEVGNLYFGGCEPTVWMLALCILVVVCQQYGGTTVFRALP